MKLVWIVNSMPAGFAAALAQPAPASGGWVSAQIEALAALPEMRLLVLCPAAGKTPRRAEANGVRYAEFPRAARPWRYSAAQERFFAELFAREKPDVVHLFGTEFPHTLAALRSAPAARTLVSVQGFAGAVAQHYLDGLPPRFSHANLLQRAADALVGVDAAALTQRHYAARGQYEREPLLLARHAVGRTAWDEAFVRAINPRVQYHRCCETLRAPFYAARWQAQTCVPHTIFISQANYPIKGMHMLLQALPLVRAQFADVQVQVAGYPRVRVGGAALRPLVDVLFDYQAYLEKLARTLCVDDCVHYMGTQNAAQMCGAYCAANVFVCPSSIENSSNSLGEAMLLGMPCVASSVGGTPDMLGEGEGILYPFADAHALAAAICRVFSAPAEAAAMGRRARAHALRTHDAAANTRCLLALYEQAAQGFPAQQPPCG